jgi:hypothetical protein
MTKQEQQLQNLKVIAIYSALGIGTATGLFLLTRKLIKKTVANKSQSKSMDEGDPATFAKQLKMAFDNDMPFGWGTNEEAVFRVFQEIPSKSMYAKVQKEYSHMYGRNLNADLEDELSSSEYNELIRILNGKK